MRMTYASPVDPHVHLRGDEYAHLKASFTELAFRDAHMVGYSAMIEQPNPKPNLISAEAVERRLDKLKEWTIPGNIMHRIHIGLTTDENQVRAALEAVMKRQHNLISDKTFYVHSTGNMGILDEDFQRRIWMIKGEMNYDGVSIGHFEDEKEYSPTEFTYTLPLTHSIHQHKGTELTQVIRQIRNARDANFKGTFYIAHVSNPDTVDFIESERKNLPFPVVIEATWHHLMLNWEDYRLHGNRVKMNPALRAPRRQEKLLECLLEGKIQTIGTDHAPHPVENKDSSNPPSGIPAIAFTPKGVQILVEKGISEPRLDDLLFNNSNDIFKLGLPLRRVSVPYSPQLWDAYGFNPFSRIDGTLNTNN